MVAGNVGAIERFEYTVIGDPVNESARLSELAKRDPRRPLASQRTIEAALSTESGAAEVRLWEELDAVTLRGRLEPTVVFGGILGPRPGRMQTEGVSGESKGDQRARHRYDQDHDTERRGSVAGTATAMIGRPPRVRPRWRGSVPCRSAAMPGPPLPGRCRREDGRLRRGSGAAPTTGRTAVTARYPLSPSATRVMLLGAGELGKEVIIAFQRLGVEVIAVDRYADAPGHQVAHHAEVVNMTDPAALRAVIDKYQPDYVVPEIEAIATSALAEVEADGVAEVIPSAKAAVATMDREGIRRLADEGLGLPTSPYLFADTLEELTVAAEQVGYPCGQAGDVVVGQGQSVLRGPGDLAKAWRSPTRAPGYRAAGDRRRLHRLRLRDHPAHRSGPRSRDR